MIEALEWQPPPTARRPPRLRLLASADGSNVTPVEIITERAPEQPKHAAAALRILPLEPVTARTLRLEETGRAEFEPPVRLRRAKPLAQRP